MSGRVWPEVDPHASGLHAEWYAANRAAGRLTVQRCTDCATWRHPSRYRCAACRGAARSFEPVEPLGRVVDLTVTCRALHPSFADVVPYAIAVIRLDEGPRLLVVVRSDDPSQLRPGDGVRVEVNGLGVPFAVVADRSAGQ